jgi:hypothetical protein
MKTIQQQLSEIRNSCNLIKDIVNNYECGFITITEMLGQISNVQHDVICIKNEISIEYDINLKAIDLMLTM